MGWFLEFKLLGGGASWMQLATWRANDIVHVPPRISEVQAANSRIPFFAKEGLTTFYASFFPLFSPPPLTPSFLKHNPPSPGTSKLLRRLDDMQPSGAGMRGRHIEQRGTPLNMARKNWTGETERNGKTKA